MVHIIKCLFSPRGSRSRRLKVVVVVVLGVVVVVADTLEKMCGTGHHFWG